MKKKTGAIIAAVSGVCILSTAALASYSTANGYDMLKKSVLNTQDYRNCTISGALAMHFDEKELASADFTYKADLPNNRRETTSTSVTIEDDEPYLSSSIEADDYWYYNTYDDKGNIGYFRYEQFLDFESRDFWDVHNDNRETVAKIVNFLEIAADTVVGELRNNFVCTEDTDEYTSYSITLDSVQIPEIVNAGLSAVFSMTGAGSPESYEPYDKTDVEYYLLSLGSDPIVDTVTMNYSIDKEGNFMDGDMKISFYGEDMSGNGHNMTFTLNCGISDMGTTVIETPLERGETVKEYGPDNTIITVK